ncbi:helix-turn-helix transcriptional regulator [Ralstonia sp. 24A2]|uniref:helix-turn-helix transcriptional regulator n=1 Tax=Ralstonia sp. 24A2 TaxID=3447364 RepID=UPI003F69EF5E
MTDLHLLAGGATPGTHAPPRNGWPMPAWADPPVTHMLRLLEDAFSAMDEAVLLLSGGGVIVHASALARSLLDNRCGLRVRHDRLWHPSQTVLDHLARVMATTLHTGCRSKMTVSLAWGETLSLDMAPANPQMFPSGAPLVFVRMRRNSALKQADADNLITAFEITKTEAKVLAGLVAGLAPSALAAQNGVSEHTVRSHITSMKGKMHCNRIVDLVKLAVLA